MAELRSRASLRAGKGEERENENREWAEAFRHFLKRFNKSRNRLVLPFNNALSDSTVVDHVSVPLSDSVSQYAVV